MPKFFETKEFRELDSEWRKRLEDSEFDDHEDEKRRLKNPDKRTIAWRNQARIRTYFECLDRYLVSSDKIPSRHREILERYSKGMRKRAIAKELSVSEYTVRSILAVYREIIQSSLR